MNLAIDRTVAQRYAEAFVNTLEATQSPKGLESSLQDMKFVAETYDSFKEFRDFLGSPEIGPGAKKELLDHLWSQTLGSEERGLLDLLVRWDRMDHLPIVVEETCRLAETRQGIVRGEMTTARPISLAAAEALSSSVGKHLKKKVQLERTVDPTLIGGVRIVIETFVFDASIQTRLQEIRQQLLETKVN